MSVTLGRSAVQKKIKKILASIFTFFRLAQKRLALDKKLLEHIFSEKNHRHFATIPSLIRACIQNLRPFEFFPFGEKSVFFALTSEAMVVAG